MNSSLHHVFISTFHKLDATRVKDKAVIKPLFHSQAVIDTFEFLKSNA